MSSRATAALAPVGLAGRTTVEAWLAAYDVGRTWNRTATAELLARFDEGATGVDLPPVLADTVTETAEVADSQACAQQALLYLTGAALFGMKPRKPSSEPVRLDLRED
jgi:hypothetical protein